jgi:wyosine [tRNA(Phe)-imidazoG37] synthetase (radical SAM superfamily)
VKLLYGPIDSKRYGRTQGINFLGAQKICSFDCVYCHLGPTQINMVQVKKNYDFPSPADLRAAMALHFQTAAPIVDAWVISGNGEPTLHPQFDLMIQEVTAARDTFAPGTSIHLLTNGAHLDQRKVLQGLGQVDEVVVKFDAGSNRVFQEVNAPKVRLALEKMIANTQRLKAFTVQSLFMQGQVNNTSNDCVDEWIEVIGMIKPKSVQICTLSRPSKVNLHLQAASEDTLDAIAYKLKKRTGLEAQVFAL